MKRILILAAAVIALGGEAFARLSQTENQGNAFFGKPVDPGKPGSDGITISLCSPRVCFASEQSFDFFHVWIGDCCLFEFLEIV